ncbi:MAG TPA: AsmA family protein [Casimicrobiaceae bacterium]|nr:AsmA family protein [Casimicrobiaceae bacterium]
MLPTSRRKPIFFAIGGVVGALVLLVVVTLLVLGSNARDRVQKRISDVLGMEFKVGGRVNVAFFPGFHIVMGNVLIRNRGSEVASAEQASLSIELLPMLRGEVRIDRVELEHVKMTIELARDGTFNFETQADHKATVPFGDTTTVSLSDVTLLYADRQSGTSFEAASCNVDVSHLQRRESKRATRWRSLSLAAAVACGTIRTGGLVLSDVKFSIDGKDGVFDLNPVVMHAFGGLGTGNIRADFSGSVPDYHVHYSLAKFRLAESLRALSPRNVGDGPMDFSAILAMKGVTTNEMVRSASGEASLRGHDLTLEIGDIDKELVHYQSSQNFNLVDVGALFFAGPLGLAVTKGYNFASIFQSSGGSSQIRTLVSSWRIERGLAQARDVAMATKENRIALKGRLDFVNGRFEEVVVAWIDAQGCAIAQQKIRGPFGKPEVEKPNVLISLAGPALSLLRQARSLFGGKCDVFYSGSVAPPR